MPETNPLMENEARGLLAAAVIGSIVDGGSSDAMLSHFNQRLRMTFGAHLIDCANFYRSDVFGDSWNEEDAMVQQAARDVDSGSEAAVTYELRHLRSVADGSCNDYSYTLPAQGVANPLVPTSLSIVGTDSTTPEAACTTSTNAAGCGVIRTFDYQVNDQHGQPMKVVNMTVTDVICTGSPNQLNLKGYSTSCSGATGAFSGTVGPCEKYTDGQFPERLSVCAPACKPSGICITPGQTIANQTWYINGVKLGLDVKSISYQCNKILVNGK